MSRIRLAQQGSILRSQALVLGSRNFARRIAEQLEASGYETSLFVDSHMQEPEWTDPNATDHWRTLLPKLIPKGIVHPGDSAWLERPELASIVQECGLVFMGPQPKTVSLFYNKLSFLDAATKIHIPTLRVSEEPVSTPRELERFSDSYPLVIRSVWGSARLGSECKIIRSSDQLNEGLELWLDQLRNSHGDSMIFAEQYLDGARHWMIPFARKNTGEIEFFPIVDVSLQFRQHHLIDFCPPLANEPELEAQIQQHAKKFLEDCQYVGVGTLEFLTDSDRAYLVGGYPGLSSNYGLWEKVAGTNAVQWQLTTYLGTEPPKNEKTRYRSGIASYIYAEDPLLQLPQPGTVWEINEPQKWRSPGQSVQLETWHSPKNDLSWNSDGLVALMEAWSDHPERTMDLLISHLSEVWISGSIQTNERYLNNLLSHSWVREGMIHSGFLEEDFIPASDMPTLNLLLATTLCSELMKLKTSGQWRAWGKKIPDPSRLKLRWTTGPEAISVSAPVPAGKTRFRTIEPLAGVSGVIEFEAPGDGEILSRRVCAFPVRDLHWMVRIENFFIPVKYVPSDLEELYIYALSAGRVHSLLQKEGSEANAHSPILLIESLQSLVPHSLPVNVRVKKWLVRTEEIIQRSQPLALIERI